MLEIIDKCQIQALPWGELQGALQKKEGEAIIAGLAVTDENRAKFAFSRPYLQFPARFITPKVKSLTEPLVEKLKGERVGVVAGSAHERMLRDYFPDVKAVTFEKQEWMLADLKAGKIAAAFGDGMRLGFWLAGSDSADCCRFSGGPYLAPEYLGAGPGGRRFTRRCRSSRQRSTMPCTRSIRTARLPSSTCAISRSASSDEHSCQRAVARLGRPFDGRDRRDRRTGFP